jgi:hypothetical protein
VAETEGGPEATIAPATARTVDDTSVEEWPGGAKAIIAGLGGTTTSTGDQENRERLSQKWQQKTENCCNYVPNDVMCVLAVFSFPSCYFFPLCFFVFFFYCSMNDIRVILHGFFLHFFI